LSNFAERSVARILQKIFPPNYIRMKTRSLDPFALAQKHEDFFQRVYAVVCQIPFGKVSTYGHIARALGARSSARMVGWALNSVPDRLEVPCHRVVNRNGELTGKIHFATPTLMRELLEGEEVEFIGEAVNMKKHLWIPPVEDMD
jgi:methylated-DNA-protein-cysteine methyltransferase-like protein